MSITGFPSKFLIVKKNEWTIVTHFKEAFLAVKFSVIFEYSWILHRNVTLFLFMAVWNTVYLNKPNAEIKASLSQLEFCSVVCFMFNFMSLDSGLLN